MNKKILTGICMLFAVSAFAQRTQQITKQQLFELFKEDYTFWTPGANYLVKSKEPSINYFFLSPDQQAITIKKLSVKNVEDMLMPPQKMPIYDSVGMLSKYIIERTEKGKASSLLIRQSANQSSEIGYGWLWEITQGDVPGTHYFTVNTDALAGIGDKRRSLFLKLLTDKDFAASIDSVLSVTESGKNRSYAVLYDKINQPGGDADSVRYNFLYTLVDVAFEKFNKSFSKAYYAKGVKNYRVGMDSNYRMILKPYDAFYYRELLVFDSLGNPVKTVKAESLSEYKLQKLLVTYANAQSASSNREKYIGCSGAKELIRDDGTSADTEIIVSQKSFFNQADAFSKNLAEYLLSIYE